MSFVTLSEVKDALGVTTTLRDAQYTSLIPAAESVVERWAKRKFSSALRTEYYSGTNNRKLILRKYPVVSVTSVWLDTSAAYGDSPTAFPDTSLLVSGTDYTLMREGSVDSTCDSGVLLRLNALWPQVSRISVFGLLNVEPGPDYGNIKVTYTAGYGVIPEDVKLAVAQLCEWFRVHSFGKDIHSEKIGDYAVSYVNQNVHLYPELGSLRNTVAQYRDPVI